MPLQQEPPTDADDVISAFRLGWAIAELRGRYRPDLQKAASEQATHGAKRPEHALPLFDERSWKEQRIEVEEIVDALSVALNLEELASDGRQVGFKQLQKPMSDLDGNPDDAKTWNQLTEGFYEWDAAIQDELTLKPRPAAGYQLGRGLSEAYWNLHPELDDPSDFRSWTFLLGEHRRATLITLLRRLAAYVDRLTVPAVMTSLEGWGEVAADRRWRAAPDARGVLREQAVLWRDLIRGEQRSEDLDLRGRSAFSAVGVLVPLLRTLYPQLILIGAAIVALLIGATHLASGTKSTSPNVIYTILGGLGITSASLYAKAKSAATSLFALLRATFDADRAGRAATILPKMPRSRRANPKRLARSGIRQLGGW